MLHGLVNAQWITLHGLVILLGLAVFVVASRVRGQRRHPSAAMAWVVALALLPYVALPLYLLIGNRKVARGRPGPAVRLLSGDSTGVETQAERFRHLAEAMGLAPATSYQDLALHENGAAALRALRAVMQAADETLDVCSFLLGRDPLGDEIAGLLAERARAGVRVRLLIDGVGRYLGGRPDLKRLSAAGVKVAVFVSPFRSALPGRTNLRNHRKLVIADGRRTWTGGRNLAAEYFVGDAKAPTPWIDLSFDFTGDLARQTQERFDVDWAFATHEELPTRTDHCRSPAPSLGDLAQLIASGPDQVDDTLYALLISSCFTARLRIAAITPYFVPDAMLMLALTLAARRGVAVDLVLPRHSNHHLADMARNSALRELAAAGGRIWLVPHMVHAKLVLIDEALALAGSANLDERSLFLNYELMLAFYAHADVARFSQWMDALRATGERYVAQAPGPVRQLGEGLVRWLAFQL
jgi:cardiolipin synthase